MAQCVRDAIPIPGSQYVLMRVADISTDDGLRLLHEEEQFSKTVAVPIPVVVVVSPPSLFLTLHSRKTALSIPFARCRVAPFSYQRYH